MNKPVVCHYCEKAARLDLDDTILDRKGGFYYHAECIPEDSSMFDNMLAIIEITTNGTNFANAKIKREDL